jgi:ComF family protein
MLNKIASIPHILKSVPSHYVNILQYTNSKIRKLPSICFLCNQYHRENDAICAECSNFFQTLGHACDYCAKPLPNIENTICNACSLNKPFVDKVFTAYLFEEPLRTLLHEFKYHNGLFLASLLTKLMLKAPIDKDKIGCLMPIPLHHKKLKERGFNQAAILAVNLSKIINVPYDINSTQKTRGTRAQAGLKAEERGINLQNAFVSEKQSYKQITLVDDLLTTGSTANELAKTLKEQGAEKVYLWCCARAAM